MVGTAHPYGVTRHLSFGIEEKHDGDGRLAAAAVPGRCLGLERRWATLEHVESVAGPAEQAADGLPARPLPGPAAIAVGVVVVNVEQSARGLDVLFHADPAASTAFVLHGEQFNEAHHREVMPKDPRLAGSAFPVALPSQVKFALMVLLEPLRAAVRILGPPPPTTFELANVAGPILPRPVVAQDMGSP